jgi:hypothetical protein
MYLLLFGIILLVVLFVTQPLSRAADEDSKTYGDKP